MILRKLDNNHNPYDKSNALSMLNGHQSDSSVVTGLIYLDKNEMDLHDTIPTYISPSIFSPEKELTLVPSGLDFVNKICISYISALSFSVQSFDCS